MIMELKRCSDCANGAWTGEERTLPEVCTICRFKSDGEPSEWKPKVFTNADRIRAMSDEELASFIASLDCPDRWRECNGHCDECVLGWLKQPAEE